MRVCRKNYKLGRSEWGAYDFEEIEDRNGEIKYIQMMKERKSDRIK